VISFKGAYGCRKARAKKLFGLEQLLQVGKNRDIRVRENGTNEKFVAGTARESERESPTVTVARERRVIGKRKKKDKVG